MSWSRLGAKATGIDFSDIAIDLARALNDEVGTDARFIRSDAICPARRAARGTGGLSLPMPLFSGVRSNRHVSTNVA